LLYGNSNKVEHYLEKESKVDFLPQALKAYIQARDEFLHASYPQALNHFQELISSKDVNVELIHWARLYKAHTHLKMSQYKESLNQLDSIKNQLTKGANNYYLHGKLMQAFGNVCFKIGAFDEAINHYSQSASSFDQINDSIGIIGTLADKAGVDFKLKKYVSSEKIYAHCSKFNLKRNFSQKYAKNLRNQIASILIGKKELDHKYTLLDSLFVSAIKKSKECGDFITTGNLFDLKATYYYFLKNKRKQRNNLDSAIHYFKEINYSRGLAKLKVNLAIFYLRDKNNHLAKKYFEEGLESAKKVQYKSIGAKAALQLSRLSNNVGSFEEAYKFLQIHQAYKDSLNDASKQKALVLGNIQFDTERKEIALLEERHKNLNSELKIDSQKKVIYTIGIGAFILLLYMFSLYNVQKLKKRNAEQALHQKELEKETAILELIQNHRYEKLLARMEGEEQERDRLSKEIHDGIGPTLSGLTLQLEAMGQRENYTNLPKIIDQIRGSYKELRSISHDTHIPHIVDNTLIELTKNLLANISNESSLKIIFVVFPENEAMSFKERAAINIYRIVQELLSNVIKHSAASKVELHFTKTNNHFSLSIEDNGKGFEPKSSKHGIGLHNIGDRVEMMNGYLNIDSRIGLGTSIQINFEDSGIFT